MIAFRVLQRTFWQDMMQKSSLSSPGSWLDLDVDEIAVAADRRAS
jgi:hypothetical protein